MNIEITMELDERFLDHAHETGVIKEVHAALIRALLPFGDDIQIGPVSET